MGILCDVIKKKGFSLSAFLTRKITRLAFPIFLTASLSRILYVIHTALSLSLSPLALSFSQMLPIRMFLFVSLSQSRVHMIDACVKLGRNKTWRQRTSTGFQSCIEWICSFIVELQQKQLLETLKKNERSDD